jgi:hypothetical protein
MANTSLLLDVYYFVIGTLKRKLSLMRILLVWNSSTCYNRMHVLVSMSPDMNDSHTPLASYLRT